MTTEAAKAAKAKYDAKTAKYFSLKLNTNTDKDIISHLELFFFDAETKKLATKLVVEDLVEDTEYPESYDDITYIILTGGASIPFFASNGDVSISCSCVAGMGSSLSTRMLSKSTSETRP